MHADRARERQPEDAEAVGHADGQMDRQSRWRHEPTVEGCSGDSPLLVQQSGRRDIRQSFSLLIDGHCQLPTCLPFVLWSTLQPKTIGRPAMIKVSVMYPNTP